MSKPSSAETTLEDLDKRFGESGALMIEAYEELKWWSETAVSLYDQVVEAGLVPHLPKRKRSS